MYLVLNVCSIVSSFVACPNQWWLVSLLISGLWNDIDLIMHWLTLQMLTNNYHLSLMSWSIIFIMHSNICFGRSFILHLVQEETNKKYHGIDVLNMVFSEAPENMKWVQYNMYFVHMKVSWCHPYTKMYFMLSIGTNAFKFVYLIKKYPAIVFLVHLKSANWNN